MAYYRVCPNCGCHLDPGERCDCTAQKEPTKVKAPVETFGVIAGRALAKAITQMTESSRAQTGTH